MQVEVEVKVGGVSGLKAVSGEVLVRVGFWKILFACRDILSSLKNWGGQNWQRGGGGAAPFCSRVSLGLRGAAMMQARLCKAVWCQMDVDWMVSALGGCNGWM